jgi:hypothetical protein
LPWTGSDDVLRYVQAGLDVSEGARPGGGSDWYVSILGHDAAKTLKQWTVQHPIGRREQAWPYRPGSVKGTLERMIPQEITGMRPEERFGFRRLELNIGGQQPVANVQPAMRVDETLWPGGVLAFGDPLPEAYGAYIDKPLRIPLPMETFNEMQSAVFQMEPGLEGRAIRARSQTKIGTVTFDRTVGKSTETISEDIFATGGTQGTRLGSDLSLQVPPAFNYLTGKFGGMLPDVDDKNMGRMSSIEGRLNANFPGQVVFEGQRDPYLYMDAQAQVDIAPKGGGAKGGLIPIADDMVQALNLAPRLRVNVGGSQGDYSIVTGGTKGGLSDFIRSGFGTLTPEKQAEMVGLLGGRTGDVLGRLITTFRDKYDKPAPAEMLGGMYKLLSKQEEFYAPTENYFGLFEEIRKAVYGLPAEESLGRFGWAGVEPQWIPQGPMNQAAVKLQRRYAIDIAAKELEGIHGEGGFTGQDIRNRVRESYRARYALTDALTGHDLYDVEAKSGGIYGPLAMPFTPEFASGQPRLGIDERLALGSMFPDLAKQLGVHPSQPSAATGFVPPHVQAWQQMGQVYAYQKAGRMAPEGAISISPEQAKDIENRLAFAPRGGYSMNEYAEMLAEVTEGATGSGAPLYFPQRQLLPNPMQVIAASEFQFDDPALQKSVSQLGLIYHKSLQEAAQGGFVAFGQQRHSEVANRWQETVSGPASLRKMFHGFSRLFTMASGSGGEAPRNFWSSFVQASTGGRFYGAPGAGMFETVVQDDEFYRLSRMMKGADQLSDKQMRAVMDDLYTMQGAPGLAHRYPTISQEAGFAPVNIATPAMMRKRGIPVAEASRHKRSGELVPGFFGVTQQSVGWGAGLGEYFTGDYDRDPGTLTIATTIDPATAMMALDDEEYINRLQQLTPGGMAREFERAMVAQFGSHEGVAGGEFNQIYSAVKDITTSQKDYLSILKKAKDPNAAQLVMMEEKPGFMRAGMGMMVDEGYNILMNKWGMGKAYNLRRHLQAAASAMKYPNQTISGGHTSQSVNYQSYLDLLVDVSKMGGFRDMETMFNSMIFDTGPEKSAQLMGITTPGSPHHTFWSAAGTNFQQQLEGILPMMAQRDASRLGMSDMNYGGYAFGFSTNPQEIQAIEKVLTEQGNIATGMAEFIRQNKGYDISRSVFATTMISAADIASQARLSHSNPNASVYGLVGDQTFPLHGREVPLSGLRRDPLIESTSALYHQMRYQQLPDPHLAARLEALDIPAHMVELVLSSPINAGVSADSPESPAQQLAGNLKAASSRFTLRASDIGALAFPGGQHGLYGDATSMKYQNQAAMRSIASQVLGLDYKEVNRLFPLDNKARARTKAGDQFEQQLVDAIYEGKALHTLTDVWAPPMLTPEGNINVLESHEAIKGTSGYVRARTDLVARFKGEGGGLVFPEVKFTTGGVEPTGEVDASGERLYRYTPGGEEQARKKLASPGIRAQSAATAYIVEQMMKSYGYKGFQAAFEGLGFYDTVNDEAQMKRYYEAAKKGGVWGMVISGYGDIDDLQFEEKHFKAKRYYGHVEDAAKFLEKGVLTAGGLTTYGARLAKAMDAADLPIPEMLIPYTLGDGEKNVPPSDQVHVSPKGGVRKTNDGLRWDPRAYKGEGGYRDQGRYAGKAAEDVPEWFQRSIFGQRGGDDGGRLPPDDMRAAWDFFGGNFGGGGGDRGGGGDEGFTTSGGWRSFNKNRANVHAAYWSGIRMSDNQRYTGFLGRMSRRLAEIGGIGITSRGRVDPSIPIDTLMGKAMQEDPGEVMRFFKGEEGTINELQTYLDRLEKGYGALNQVAPHLRGINDKDPGGWKGTIAATLTAASTGGEGDLRDLTSSAVGGRAIKQALGFVDDYEKVAGFTKEQMQELGVVAKEVKENMKKLVKAMDADDKAGVESYEHKVNKGLARTAVLRAEAGYQEAQAMSAAADLAEGPEAPMMQATAHLEETEAAKKLAGARAAQRNLNKSGRELIAGELGTATRRLIGGWGLFYMGHLMQLGLGPMSYGLQEGAQFQQETYAAMGSYGAGTIRQPNFGTTQLASQIAYGGGAMRSLSILGAGAPAPLRDMAGAGMTGLAAFAGLEFAAGAMGPQSKIGGILSSAAPYAIPLVAGGMLAAQSLAYRADPQGTFEQATAAQARSGWAGDLGRMVSAGWYSSIGHLGPDTTQRSKELAHYATGGKLTNPVGSWADPESSRYLNNAIISPDGPQTSEEMAAFARAVATTDIEGLRHIDPGLRGQAAIFLESAGAFSLAGVQQIGEAQQLRGIDVFGLSGQLMGAAGGAISQDRYVAAVRGVSSLKDQYAAMNLGRGIERLGQVSRMYGQQALGSAARSEDFGIRELWRRQPDVQLAKHFSAYGEVEQGLNIRASNVMMNMASIGMAYTPPNIDVEMSPEMRAIVSDRLDRDEARTALYARARQAGVDSSLLPGVDAPWSEINLANQAQGVADQAAALGFSDTSQFYTQGQTGLQGQVRAQTALTYGGLVATTTGSMVQGRVRTLRAKRMDYTSTNRLQRMMGGSKLAWTQAALAGDAPNYMAVGDIGIDGQPTGLPLWTSSLSMGTQTPYETAMQIWGPDIGPQEELTGVRGAMVNGFTLPSGREVQGATAGQAYMSQLSYESQMASAGNAMAQARLSYAFQTGVGLDNYNTVDPRTGQPFNLREGGIWGIQDAMFNLGQRQQRANFQYQQQMFDLQGVQFQENIQLQRRQTLTQRGFTMQDWAFQDTTRNLQWQWRQEDFGEQVRFMTGRERRLSERGMERETTMFNLQGDQITRKRDQQQELWQLEDERFELQKKHYQETRDLQQEQMDKAVEFFEQRTKLEEASRELQRAFFIEQNKLQMAAAGAAAHYATKMKEARDDMFEFGVEQAENIAKFGMVIEDTETLTELLTKYVDTAIFKIRMALKELGGTNDTRAGGGIVLAGGSYIVGEDEPELFKPLVSGVIIPKQKLEDPWYNTVFGGGGSTQRVVSGSPTIHVFIGNQEIKDYVVETVDEEFRMF